MTSERSHDSSRRRRTLVIQPLPGIGDTVWHLRHLRALARAAPDGKICLLTKPRSRADRLLVADPAIDEVLWVHRNRGVHDGVRGFLRLVALLREGRFANAWILHDSARYAEAAWAAGIPERHGYGTGTQRWFLNRPPFLPRALVRGHPIDKASRFCEDKGLTLRDEDGALAIGDEAARIVADRFGELPRPWIAIGLGSSEPFKQWGTENFSSLARRIGDRTRRSLFLVGGAGEKEMSERIARDMAGSGAAVALTYDLPIDQVSALLARCSLYVGNDTGFANIAAAVRTDAVCLFGGSPPLTYSPFFHVVLPEHPGSGMAGISVDQVVGEVRAFDIG